MRSIIQPKGNFGRDTTLNKITKKVHIPASKGLMERNTTFPTTEGLMEGVPHKYNNIMAHIPTQKRGHGTDTKI